MLRAIPLSEAPRLPATAGLAGLAIVTTVLAWTGRDVEVLTMSYRAFEDQPWRLVTSALPHVGISHLAFNVVWLWILGARIETRYGSARALALYLTCAVVSTAAEHAVFEGGVGLSGVGYGLAGYLAVASRRDPRLADAIDGGTVLLFVAWFFFCVATTVTGTFRVANVAHGAGAIVGALTGAAVTHPPRLAGSIGVALFSLVALAGSSFARPLVNFGQGSASASLDADAAFGRGDYAEAERLYRYAASVDPEEPRNWHNVGVCQERLGEPALDAYGRAHALAQDDARYAEALAAEHTRLGFEAYERSDWDAAIAHHRAALEAAPDERGDRHHRLCLALLAADRPTLEPCRYAHELAPGDVAFTRALAAVHRSLGMDAWEREDWAGAVEHYGLARQLTGESVDWHNAALASERAGDLATALRGFERALELDPAFAPAAEGAARTRAALGE